MHLAAAEFGIKWSDLLTQYEVASFVDSFSVWNEIDRFWILAARTSMSIKEAVRSWPDFHPTGEWHPAFLRDAGAYLCELAATHKLTHGEIGLVLLNIRQSDVKSLIQVERHPNDPDKPGGTA